MLLVFPSSERYWSTNRITLQSRILQAYRSFPGSVALHLSVVCVARIADYPSTYLNVVEIPQHCPCIFIHSLRHFSIIINSLRNNRMIWNKSPSVAPKFKYVQWVAPFMNIRTAHCTRKYSTKLCDSRIMITTAFLLDEGICVSRAPHSLRVVHRICIHYDTLRHSNPIAINGSLSTFLFNSCHGR